MRFVAARVFNWYPVEVDDSWGLKTIAHGHAYSICNSLLCDESGLLFLDVRFSDEELCWLYSDYRGREYSELREKFEPGYIDRNQMLNQGVPFLNEVEAFIRPHLQFPIALLDWGAVAVDEKIASQTEYQLIVCSQVLEHTPFPRQVLESIRRAMTKDTLLYIDVPYEAHMRNNPLGDALYKKKHWHEHINFYLPKSLRSLVQSCQFQMVDENILMVEGRESPISMLQVICKLG